MLQIPTNPEAAPRDLADVLDDLIAAHHQDREIGTLLAATREQLRALAWNRYASAVGRISERRIVQRRHKTMTARRLMLEGARHA